MNQTETILKQAEQQCHASGQRFTDKRKTILNGLLRSKKALSAYELVDFCETHLNRTIPVMSVYRILEFLQANGLVHKLDTTNKFIACAHITCDHPHGITQFLICSGCNEVKEILMDRSIIGAIEDKVKKVGFHLMKPQLEIKCLCDPCMVQGA